MEIESEEGALRLEGIWQGAPVFTKKFTPHASNPPRVAGSIAENV
jgi:hypothetical protein